MRPTSVSYPDVAHCTSCGAPVEWVITKNGARMPLDLRSRPNGNLMLGEDGIVRNVGKGAGNRVSHFATCPDAISHRKRR